MMTNNIPSLTKAETFVSLAQAARAGQDGRGKAIDSDEKHLCTDHLMGDLRDRTISGGFITIGDLNA